MVQATVRWFNADEGWGVLDAPGVPGAIFVHFSGIEMDGYKTLQAGQAVEVGEVEGPLSYDQDGCRYRATGVRPA
jgi:CspA family cold shock protein